MAGSYRHVTTKKGKLASPAKMTVENLGDAYEAIEEMYGMIWILASQLAGESFGAGADPKLYIKDAETRYRQGLDIAKKELKK